MGLKWASILCRLYLVSQMVYSTVFVVSDAHPCLFESVVCIICVGDFILTSQEDILTFVRGLSTS